MQTLSRIIDYPECSSYNYDSYSKIITNIKNESRNVDKSLIVDNDVSISIEELNEKIPDSSRFIIDCHNEFLQDTVFIKQGDVPYLFVTLTGARNDINTLGSFSRWSYYPYYNGHMLSFLDPMFRKFSTLKLGWYYGTESFNLLQQLANIILIFAKHLNIENKNIIFFASSGGGTAALYLSSIIENSNCIAYNPQIFLTDWPYSNIFMKITGINLYNKDKFKRNDIVSLLLNNKNSKYFIIQNIQSELDYSGQILNLAKVLDVKLKYGIVNKDNIYIGLINVKSKRAHSAFESRSILFLINFFMYNIMKNKKITHLEESMFLGLAELWAEHHTNKEAIVKLREKYNNVS